MSIPNWFENFFYLTFLVFIALLIFVITTGFKGLDGI